MKTTWKNYFIKKKFEKQKYIAEVWPEVRKEGKRHFIFVNAFKTSLVWSISFSIANWIIAPVLSDNAPMGQFSVLYLVSMIVFFFFVYAMLYHAQWDMNEEKYLKTNH